MNNDRRHRPYKPPVYVAHVWLVTDCDEKLYLGDDEDEARALYHKRRSLYRDKFRNNVRIYRLTEEG